MAAPVGQCVYSAPALCMSNPSRCCLIDTSLLGGQTGAEPPGVIPWVRLVHITSKDGKIGYSEGGYYVVGKQNETAKAGSILLRTG